MNFLQLCQRLNRESGAISGDATPSAVTGQTGQLLKTVEWVAQAWVDIQKMHEWRWMRTEWSYEINSPTSRYLPAAFNLTRFTKWIAEDRAPMSIYKSSLGVSDETDLEWCDWRDYRQTFGKGSQVSDRPRFVAISPQNELCFGPSPDVAYTARGEYQKGPQLLAANADIPELPGGDGDHLLIVWHALLYKYENVGATVDLALIGRRYWALMDPLMRHQLEQVTFQQSTGPVA